MLDKPLSQYTASELKTFLKASSVWLSQRENKAALFNKALQKLKSSTDKDDGDDKADLGKVDGAGDGEASGGEALGVGEHHARDAESCDGGEEQDVDVWHDAEEEGNDKEIMMMAGTVTPKSQVPHGDVAAASVTPGSTLRPRCS